MPTEDLTPKILSREDTTRFTDGVVTDVTVFRFKLGRFGPIVRELPAKHTRYDIEQMFAEAKATLDGLV